MKNSVINVSASPSRIRYRPGVTAETAPNWVYATAEALPNGSNSNITWVFDVDPRFSYFVRLHFCNIISKDFVSNASSDNTLTVSVGPNTVAGTTNATMNGLEIMKISNALKSLDGSGSDGSGSRNKHIIVVVVVVVVILTLLVLLFAGIQYYRKKKLPQENSKEDTVLENLTGMPIRFVYKDLEVATNNFSVKLGQGGFGSVYKGVLPDGTELAVKQLEGIGQGKKEFRAEISIIGSIHHFNLVRLKGFCEDGTHRLLVYEYMANNSLDKWIFKKKKSECMLDWDTRFNIALGTAKGLAYLHDECDLKIVHCDIKPENVLLDDHFIAKVSDFGLAKLMTREQSHVFTTLRGTRGYLAPEWIRNCPISEKSDVYSYGMVLLEIIGGRKNYDPNETSEKFNFPRFAFKMMEEGKVRDILDPELKIDDEHDDDKVHCAISVALWCIQENMSMRPSMTKVVQMLEGLCTVPKPPKSSNQGDTSSDSYLVQDSNALCAMNGSIVCEVGYYCIFQS
ncbi:G-type lectin S-receptor-like serine/threonine-protein kinase [Trifolium pratense]|uniref:non-specific serine/threonine protein kinase n=1 Tax=Trifolium pratense TaxID=57577 RepID=A0A2K3L5B7_TRIPR|nr:G-type lectin S-receptor-like serine/threonine-protein kinase [Trifolium pratense]